MENYWNDYPPHIKYLIEDLESSEDTLSVLMKYTSTLQTDIYLKELYLNIGYNESTESFTKDLYRPEVLSLVKNYYESSEPNYYDYVMDT